MPFKKFGVNNPFNEEVGMEPVINIDWATIDPNNKRQVKLAIEALAVATKNKVKGKAILEKGEKFKRRLILTHGLHEGDLKEGTIIPLQFDLNDLKIMMGNTNNINRAFKVNKALKYYEQLLNGTWSFKHPAGKRLEYSFYGFQMLSCQHRVVVMYIAMRLGLIQNWNISLELSDPEIWAAKEGQDMSEADRAVIFHNLSLMKNARGERLSEDATKLLMRVRPRVYHAEKDRSSNSGMSADTKILVREFLEKYQHKMFDFTQIWSEDEMPRQYRDSSNIKGALCVLYLTGHLSDVQLRELKDETSFISGTIATMIKEGFGQAGSNNLHYAIAVLKHSSILQGVKHYSNISKDMRPNLNDKKNTYLFDEYPINF